MRRLRVHNSSRETLLADRAQIADSSKTRKIGLLKHERLEPGDGLWITPCEGVHTVGMKFPIDVLYLDKQRKVVKIRAAMPRWRMSACLWAHSVSSCRAVRPPQPAPLAAINWFWNLTKPSAAPAVGGRSS